MSFSSFVESHRAFSKKNKKPLTIKQEVKRLKKMAAVLISSYILLVLAAITAVSFENTRVRQYYIDELAVARITNTGDINHKVTDSFFNFYYQELESFQFLLDKESFDITDEDSLQTVISNHVTLSVLTDIGVIYNSKIFFPNKNPIEIQGVPEITGKMLFDGKKIQVKNTDEEYIYVAIPACENHQELQGVVGRITKRRCTDDIASTSYQANASSVIVDSNYDMVLISSPKHMWRFAGYTNFIVAMRDWVDDADFARYQEFIKKPEEKTINVGKGDNDGMLYQDKFAFSDGSEYYFIFLAPTSMLTDTISHLSLSLLIMLYASLTLSSVLLTAAIIIIFRQLIANKLISAYTAQTGLNVESSFFHDCTAITFNNIQQSYGIVYLNIKDLKKININYGTQFANEVINTIGVHLAEHILEDECACIQNGNFLILVKGNNDDVLLKMTDLYNHLKEYDKLKLVQIKLSFGIKMMDKGYYGEIPLEIADAKFAESQTTEDNPFCFYSETMHQIQEENEELIDQFDRALENHEFEVYLQLKYDLNKKDWGGAEALVRWNHPIKGLIPPGKFIPLFEENGFVTKLDVYMFEETCKILNEMIENGEKVVPVSINLSKRHFINDSFIENYIEIANKYNVPHELIEFEITEGLLMDNVETFATFISIFHENNYDIAMDDFGAGYSSLNMIHQLDFDVIKVDSKFFRDGLDDANKTIIQSIIDLCHKLNKVVVAEGVEEKHEVDFLKEIGCDIIQGYYYSKPLPLAEFKKKILTNPEADETKKEAD